MKVATSIGIFVYFVVKGFDYVEVLLSTCTRFLEFTDE